MTQYMFSRHFPGTKNNGRRQEKQRKSMEQRSYKNPAWYVVRWNDSGGIWSFQRDPKKLVKFIRGYWLVILHILDNVVGL